VIDKLECLCLQIGLAEAIYVRPSDPNQINIWLKVNNIFSGIIDWIFLFKGISRSDILSKI
jgi:hypothetical protein